MQSLLREKDQMIDNLRKQAEQLKEDNRLKDLEIKEALKRSEHDDKER